jgi:hypothetical protein
VRSSALFDRQAKIALILVCTTLTVGGLGFQSAVRALNVYMTKEPVDLRWHFDNIATSLPSWESEGEIRKLSKELVEELGTNLYLDRKYVDQDDPDKGWIQLHIAYYTGMIDAVPHVPDRCLVAAGFNTRTQPQNLVLDVDTSDWRTDIEPVGDDLVFPEISYRDPITRSALTVRMPIGEFRLRTTEFSRDEMQDQRVFAGYFFIANGRVAVTPEDVKMLAFRKSEQYAYYCKVQFLSVGRELTEEQFIDRSGRFLEELLPELMRCLPDWTEILSESTPHAGGSDV